jgi:hypothetical protein
MAVDRRVAAWCELDRARALVPADRAAIDATLAARALVVESVLSGAERDLYNACAVLGRLLAEHGASPTFAAGTIDGAQAVLAPEESRIDWLVPARAAVAEGFVARLRERAAEEARARWEYPRCAVRVDERTVALAAGHPEDDADALDAWAERVALGCNKAGVKRAIVAGPERATEALVSALASVGIQRVGSVAEKRAGLWPWRRKG